MKNWIALGAGVFFAVGLGISGMLLPENIHGFLRITDNWKPELLGVMGGAIGVHALLYFFWIRKRSQPLQETRFHLPWKKTPDWKLILGSALFGIGWSLAGYCPGPGLVSLGSFRFESFVFVGSMLTGMGVIKAGKLLQRSYQNKKQPSHPHENDLATC